MMMSRPKMREASRPWMERPWAGSETRARTSMSQGASGCGAGMKVTLERSRISWPGAAIDRLVPCDVKLRTGQVERIQEVIDNRHIFLR